MNQKHDNSNPRPLVSIAVFAWNEEASIRKLLASLSEQTLFQELAQRQLQAEVVCVLNGCTDNTAAVARRFFEDIASRIPFASSLQWRILDLEQRGKLNAWNEFVHRESAKSVEYLFMMDADIEIHLRETLWNMLTALRDDPEAAVSIDQPCKDLQFKNRPSIRDRLSMNASGITKAAAAQLCAQLYCIRASTARNIHLPKDLPACEDGFIKALVCTDFLEHPPEPKRMRLAPGAAHVFEAYTSLPALLKNQKRQVIGQTVVHLLVDQYLPALPPSERRQPGEHLRTRDATDPDWLKRLIAQHLARTKWFWRVCPGYAATPFKRWRALGMSRRIVTFPAALGSSLLALIGSYAAFRSLKNGCTDYWPRAERRSSALSTGELLGPVVITRTEQQSTH